MSPSDQARSLIKAYIRAGAEHSVSIPSSSHSNLLYHPRPAVTTRSDQPQELPEVPPKLTPQQLAFLKSWRSLRARGIAIGGSNLSGVWIRTHYNLETDIKYAAIISKVGMRNVIDSRLLNDVSLYENLS